MSNDTFQVTFENQRQCIIADMLWSCTSKEDVDKMIKTIGPEAEVVYQIIMAESIDHELKKQKEFPEIKELLNTF